LQRPTSDSAALRHSDGLAPPTVLAVRVDHAPLIDGRLDDPAWALATPITQLVQTDPEEGNPVSESTEVRILYDHEAIYVGARLYDREPQRIVHRLGRRDVDTQSDDFRVLFDSYHDHRTAFRFTVNAAGVKQDILFGDDGAFADTSWDPVWDVATTVDSLGWTAEMRIPFSQLRFSGAHEQVWGVRFVRWIQRKNEFALFPFVGKTESGFASRFAHLVGLGDIAAPRRLELLPYTVGRGTYDTPPALNDPFDRGHSYFGGAGVDVKYGLSSNLTLDATVNPDFGQVELDPSFVNLTAFEQFLPERRPFFVEGRDIFGFGGTGQWISFANTPQYFYSRRIGRPPQLNATVPAGGFADVPGHTTILGAAKVTGRTVGGWSMGVLDALTGSATATLDSSAVRWSQVVEPLTNYVVARIKRDFAGRGGVGFLATGVTRRIDAAALDSLRRGAYLAGTDFYHRWHGNDYSLQGSVGVSYVTGDTLALQATQQQSSRYFQRPDATNYLRYDPHRTSLAGATGDLAVSKDGGNANWSLAFGTSTPGFEVNDLGFQHRADRISMDAFVGYRWTRPGKVFRQASIAADPVGFSWNYGGDRILQIYDLNLFGELLNYWGGNAGVFHQAQAIDDRLTRGGPSALLPETWSLFGSLFSDQRRLVNATVNVNHVHDAAGGWTFQLTPVFAIRPSGAVQIQLTPDYLVGRSAAQYVTTQGDPAASTTYGARYVFAELVQHQADVTVRLNLTFTPTVSLQLYAQPFTFAAGYQSFKELRAPRTFTFNVYGRDNGSTISYDPSTSLYTVHPDGARPADSFQFANPDFRQRSLRSSLVLRWEYRPGSTAFVVWTQSRFGSLASAAFDAPNFFAHEVFRDPPTNVFLVKVSYWLSR
jgi:hypothetical protein